MTETIPLTSQPPSPKGNSSLLKQTLLVWVLSMVAIRGLHELQRFSGFIRENVMLFTGILLIYVPLWVLWRRKERIDFFEGSWKQLARSIGWFLLLSVIIFPIIEVGNRYFQQRVFHLHYVGGNYQGLANAAFFHLLLVALPEEFFFRGYLQCQLNRVWGRPLNFLGAKVGWSLIVTSLFFAFSHSLIQKQWWHFSIFFPALVFGWLREKTNAITAGTLFHALSNVYSFWVFLNYHR